MNVNKLSYEKNQKNKTLNLNLKVKLIELNELNFINISFIFAALLSSIETK